MTHTWTKKSVPSEAEVYKEMNDRYKKMHEGRDMKQISVSLLNEIIEKNKAKDSIVRMSGRMGMSRELDLFRESFESQTSMFTTLSAEFIFDTIQGKLQEQNIMPDVDDNLYQL